MEQSFSVFNALQEAIEQMTWIEIWAVITGLIYVILAAREQIWCWFFGIISSVLSIYLFYTGKLYAESILYFYYVIAGFYGWIVWYKKEPKAKEAIDAPAKPPSELEIHTWTWKTHGLMISLGIVLSLSLAFVLQNYTDAKIPLLDAFTTVFSFIATYMVTRKVLENWLYWIIIDIVTTGMYCYRAYYLYALLMVVYTIIAVIAYWNWYKRYKKRTLTDKQLRP